MIFLVFIGSSIEAQVFRNLDFDESCFTSPTGICDWDLAWGKKTNVRRHANGLLLIGDKSADVAFIEQAAGVPPLKEVKVLTLSGSIATTGVEGKGAGLNINLYDSEGKLLAFKDMGGVYSMDWVSGTMEPRTYTIAIVCPIGTARVNIGAILYGKGTAQFANYYVGLSSITARRPRCGRESRLRRVPPIKLDLVHLAVERGPDPHRAVRHKRRPTGRG